MVIQIEFFQSKKEAILNEKYLKSGKSRLFVNSLKLLASDSYPSADGQQFNPPKNNYASFLNRVEAGTVLLHATRRGCLKRQPLFYAIECVVYIL